MRDVCVLCGRRLTESQNGALWNKVNVTDLVDRTMRGLSSTSPTRVRSRPRGHSLQPEAEAPALSAGLRSHPNAPDRHRARDQPVSSRFRQFTQPKSWYCSGRGQGKGCELGNHSRAVAVGIVQKRYGGEVGSPSTRNPTPLASRRRRRGRTLRGRHGRGRRRLGTRWRFARRFVRWPGNACHVCLFLPQEVLAVLAGPCLLFEHRGAPLFQSCSVTGAWPPSFSVRSTGPR